MACQNVDRFLSVRTLMMNNGYLPTRWEPNDDSVTYLVSRYLYVRHYLSGPIELASRQGFDRWANSTDFIIENPLGLDDNEIHDKLEEAERRAIAGERNAGWGERVPL